MRIFEDDIDTEDEISSRICILRQEPSSICTLFRELQLVKSISLRSWLYRKNGMWNPPYLQFKGESFKKVKTLRVSDFVDDILNSPESLRRFVELVTASLNNSTGVNN